MAAYLDRSVHSLANDNDQELRDRVHSRLMARSSAEGECLIYEGHWDADGRPKIKIGARRYWITRVAAWLYHGLELWDGRFAVHSCTSPACFTPDHIVICATRDECNHLLRGKIVSRGRKFNSRRREAIRNELAADPHLTVERVAIREKVRQSAISGIKNSGPFLSGHRAADAV